ncbi:hypothetical protein V496_10436 [Pseudogymnoascus sp. VKM F-4515 (FW-2607)]|nr:hypothetical protein V496_10436 [Pseudogymnoascus sp. VKM F-4515 (FW-2607)]KFY93705.1 hypothetical protein V498_04298 [Pseudogymnoascus sp. VKM F-4517 (FW-2822)]
MPSNEAPDPVKGHLVHLQDSSDAISTAKPQHAAADEQELEKPRSPGTVPEQPPRLYWLRPLVLIFIPSIITIYFAVIWVHLLQNSPRDDAVNYRTFSGSLIFYSWFLIGVFGLSWAKFGLVGVEASMLRSPFWGAPNLVALLMHSNGTWSSPSGWLNAIARREFHRLWCLLTFISILPFIALPLSGLVFEISDGYIKTSDAPSVVGRNITTFNERYDAIFGSSNLNVPAEEAWLTGASPVIPGLGIIFSGESINRSEHSVFDNLPNSLPLTESIPDLFLAPQADKPVSGQAWGLRFKYNCSIVRSASQFTILSQKAASAVSNVAVPGLVKLQTPSGDAIVLGYKVLGARGRVNSIDPNVLAYFEIGTSGSQGDSLKYDGDHPGFEADEGNGSLVVEYVAWQHRHNPLNGDIEPSLTFNSTVGPSVEGMGSPIVKASNGTYTLNSTFFALKGDLSSSASPMNANDPFDLTTMLRGSSTGEVLDAAPPIGVRCVTSSDIGTAELDGVTSTFHDFQRSSPNGSTTLGFKGARRFGYTTNGTLGADPSQHYISGGLPGLKPGKFETVFRYESFIDTDSLLRSINLAHALDASNLMYDITSGFKEEWTATGLTSSREGKILSIASLIPGSEVGYFVLALFCLWAALSAGLGLWYGFQRRPADKLDGYTMLRKGADMAGELKENDEFMSGKKYHDGSTLAALPGNILGAIY